MKNNLKVLLLLSVSLMVGSCAAKREKTDNTKKDYDEKLVHALVGSWFAKNYDYGKYDIAYDDDLLNFNSTILEIEYTEENQVFTHQKNDKTFHYIFEVKEEEVIVYPHYEVEQSGDELILGGDLAPINLKRS